MVKQVEIVAYEPNVELAILAEITTGLNRQSRKGLDEGAALYL